MPKRVTTSEVVIEMLNPLLLACNNGYYYATKNLSPMLIEVMMMLLLPNLRKAVKLSQFPLNITMIVRSGWLIAVVFRSEGSFGLEGHTGCEAREP